MSTVNPFRRDIQVVNFNIDSATSETEDEQISHRTRSVTPEVLPPAPLKVTTQKPALWKTGRMNYRLVTRQVLTRGDTTYQNTSSSSDTLVSTVKYDTLFIALPSFFTHCPNPKKSVSLLIARLFDITEMKEIAASIHSNIVQFDASADNYCCTANMLYPIPKRFVLADNKTVFEVWARDLQGNIIDFDPLKTRLILEFLLEF